MGLLDGNAIADLFGDALESIYGDGQLIRVTKQRGPGGVMINVRATPVAIKVQVDRCDEEMRSQSGYTAQDVKLLVLQSGIAGPAPTSDDIIVARGEQWSMKSIGEDPARAYWRGRGVKRNPPPIEG